MQMDECYPKDIVSEQKFKIPYLGTGNLVMYTGRRDSPVWNSWKCRNDAVGTYLRVDPDKICGLIRGLLKIPLNKTGPFTKFLQIK